MKSEKVGSFNEFWPEYVGEHLSVGSRRLHFLGTCLGLSCLALAAYFREPWFVFWAVVSGYAPAWVGHFLIEKNRPATLKYPGYSLAADFKMFYLILTGKMEDEVRRIKVAAHSKADVSMNNTQCPR